MTKLTRKERSRINKAKFAAQRAKGRGRSSSAPSRRAASPRQNGELTVTHRALKDWYKKAMRGQSYREGAEPHEHNVILFTNRGAPNVDGAKEEWTVTFGAMKSALKGMIGQIHKLALKHDMSRSYEGLMKAQDGVYYVEFGS
jgi:hypothetical protein